MVDSVYELNYFANDLIDGFVYNNRYEAIVTVDYAYDDNVESTVAKIRIEFGYQNTLSFDFATAETNPYSQSDKQWFNKETVHLDFNCEFQQFTYNRVEKELTIQSTRPSPKFKTYTVKLKQK